MSKYKKNPIEGYRKEFKNTSNSAVYNKIQQRAFWEPWNRAGHRRNCGLWHHPVRSWKQYRKVQYRERKA